MKTLILLPAFFALTANAQSMSPENMAKIAQSASRFAKDCSVADAKISDVQVTNKTSEHIDKEKLGTAILEATKLQRDPGGAKLDVVLKSMSTENPQSKSTAYTLKITFAKAGGATCTDAYPSLFVEKK